MKEWRKSPLAWVCDQVFNISVVFSWDINKAHLMAYRAMDRGFKVVIGGPATHKFTEGEEIVTRYNPCATFTSRGCIRQCKFCLVPKLEGGLRELKQWTPRPVICDNNLLACSRRHFDKVMDSLKGIEMESKVMSAINMLRENGIPKRKIGVFILIGFEDTPDDALYRLNTIRNMGFYPFPMRYQRLDAVLESMFH